jgi:hypothetical protein
MVVLAACGGDKKKEDGSSSAAATQSGAESAQQATTAPTEAARQATASPAPTQTERVIAADCLKGVKSYRYEGKVRLKLPTGQSSGLPAGIELNDVAFTGAYVAPDRSQFKVELGPTTFETIAIGNDEWTKFGPSGWIKSPGTGGLAFNPDSFCRTNLSDLDRAGVKPSKDKVNGRDALRYEYDKKTISRLNNLFGGGPLPELPDNTKVTLWVTESEHWPIRVTLAGDRSGADPYAINFEFNLTDLNKDDIKIDAPR